MSKALKIIEALGRHSDNDAVQVLDEIGTNSPLEAIREATMRALVRRNSEDSLRIIIHNKGKGVHDLNPRVAMSTINCLLELEDKTELMRVLESTISGDSDDEIRNTAKSLRALVNLSN